MRRKKRARDLERSSSPPLSSPSSVSSSEGGGKDYKEEREKRGPARSRLMYRYGRSASRRELHILTTEPNATWIDDSRIRINIPFFLRRRRGRRRRRRRMFAWPYSTRILRVPGGLGSFLWSVQIFGLALYAQTVRVCVFRTNFSSQFLGKTSLMLEIFKLLDNESIFWTLWCWIT